MEHIINIQKKLEPIGLKIGVIWILTVYAYSLVIGQPDDEL